MTISRQQLQLINRKQLRYPLDIAEKDYCLTLDAYPIDLGEVVSLLRRKEVRRPIAPSEIQANWQIARLEREDDMRSIYCAREVDNDAVAAMAAAFSFDPVLPA